MPITVGERHQSRKAGDVVPRLRAFALTRAVMSSIVRGALPVVVFCVRV